MMKLLFWFFIVFACYLFAMALLVHVAFPIVIIFLFFYFWCLLFRPEVALFFTYLVIINGFGFIPENFLRFPYLFRLRDIFFILIFIPYLRGMFLHDKRCQIVAASKIGKAIGILLIFVFFQIIATKLRYQSETLASIFRSGRQYLYYALFFPSFYIFDFCSSSAIRLVVMGKLEQAHSIPLLVYVIQEHE